MWAQKRYRSFAFLVSTGCLPEIEQIQGDRILYEHSASLHPCAGNVEYLDRLIPFLEDHLLATAPDPLRYSWLASEDIVHADSTDEGQIWGGYAVSTRYAWSRDPILPHELVHLVVGGHSSAPFFKEGLAVAMDWFPLTNIGSRYVTGSIPPDFNPLTTLSARGSASVNYPAAGLFVMYLLTQHGPVRFRKFYRSLSWPFTIDRLAASFRAAFDAELQEEVAEYMQGAPPCEADDFALQPLDCSAPLHPWSKSWEWSLAASTECDAPGVIGGIGPQGAWPSARVVTVEVPQDGRYVFGIFTSGQEWVRLGPCFGCPWDDADVLAQDGEVLHVDLKRGRYYVRVNGWSDDGHDVNVTLAVL